MISNFRVFFSPERFFAGCGSPALGCSLPARTCRRAHASIHRERTTAMPASRGPLLAWQGPSQPGSCFLRSRSRARTWAPCPSSRTRRRCSVHAGRTGAAKARQCQPSELLIEQTAAPQFFLLDRITKIFCCYHTNNLPKLLCADRRTDLKIWGQIFW